MKYEHIIAEASEGILTITLDRPTRLNTFTFPMLVEFEDALRRGNEDDEVRCVIVTGSGRAFSAGTDLSVGPGTYNGAAAEQYHCESGIPRDAGGRISLQIFDYDKPIIAAINGPATGYGASMTLPMDYRLASEDARFGFVFTRRGLVPEGCATWFLPRLVGISRALDWVHTGRVFSASEALQHGLVQEVMPRDELLPRARAIAQEIIQNTSGLATALARRMMWRMLGTDHPMEAHRVESRAIHVLRKLPDFKEGIAAFKEKRQPHFTQKARANFPDGFPWWDERPFQQ